MSDETKYKSSDLQALGTQLSERILEAQKRFAAIYKKCDHYVIRKLDGCVNPDGLGPHRQGVGFKKDGKAWKLFFVEEGELEREPTQFEEMIAGPVSLYSTRSKKVRQHYLEWNELSQASLVEKSKAVTMLPRLFEEMQAEYERRTKLVSDALQVLDELADKLPPAAQEGQ